MFMIERLSSFIAGKITDTLDLDMNKQEILAYGAFSLIQTLWAIALVGIFGILFNVFWEGMIISFSGALLRKYSGGAHATSPNRCAVIGVIVSVGPALVINWILVYTSLLHVLIYVCFTFVFTYYIIYKYSPVDTPNKPIVKEETKKRLRKAAFKMTSVFLTISIVLCLYYLKERNSTLLKAVMSICTGLLWQDITLISIGHFIMSILDSTLKNISTIDGGERI